MASSTSYVEDLYDNRVVIVAGEITEELCSEAIGRIAMLDLLGADELKPIVVLINTEGGSVASAFGVANVIESCVCPVTTVCIGSALSAGSIILISGKTRYAVPHSEIMMHQHSQELNGVSHAELMNYSKASETAYNILVEFYNKRTNLTKKQIKELLAKDSYLTAETALQYDMIDDIGWNLAEWLK
jgi:ATP-dependent Clp protease protease subunit